MSLAGAGVALRPVALASAHPQHLGAAMAVAVLSAVCYATSAVLQQRQASRQRGTSTAALLRALVRQPVWWLAITATVTGAALHVLALRLGPLSVVQPLGILTLVLALPLGAALADRRVTRSEWLAATAVMGGLAAVLATATHHLHPRYLPAAAIGVAAAAVAVLVLTALAVAVRCSDPSRAMLRAAAAATCFGTASAMARIAVTGAASRPLVGGVTIACAASGFAIAQLAYRDGGLGGPLATLILADPLVAVTLGVTLLGEPLVLTPWRVVLCLVGLVSTVLGIRHLSRAEAQRTRPAPPTPRYEHLPTGRSAAT